MAKIKPKYFSIGGNRKLAKNIAILNLPAGDTCPGQSVLCGNEGLCYAKKAERQYPATKAKRERVLTWIEEDMDHAFAEMHAELMALKEDYGVTRVRIHESGDFYSQQYFDYWVDLVEAHPDVTFLAYTKSHGLTLKKVPANLKLKQSLDKTNLKDPRIADIPKTYILTKGEAMDTTSTFLSLDDVLPMEDPFFKCPTKKEVGGEHHYCGKKCSVCWNTDNNVYFRQH